MANIGGGISGIFSGIGGYFSGQENAAGLESQAKGDFQAAKFNADAYDVAMLN